MLFQTSLGVFWEERTVSFAFLRNSWKGIQLASHGVYPFEADRPVGERVKEIATWLRDRVGRSAVSSTNLFLGIPREWVLVRYLDLPVAVKENLRGVLGYEMEKYVPFSADDVYFDYQVTGTDKEGGTVKIFLTAISKEALDPYLELGRQLNTGISGVEMSSTAVTNYLLSFKGIGNGHVPSAIVYRRDGTVEINGVQDRVLRYSRSMKAPEGEGDLERLLKTETDLIRKTLHYEKGPLTLRCYGIEKDLRPPEMAFPEDETVIEVPPLLLPSHLLIPAYGLALKGMLKLPMEINLLPGELRKKASKAAYYTTLVLLGLTLFTALGWGGSAVLRREYYMRELDREIKRLGSQVTTIRDLENQCKAIEARMDYLNGLNESRVSLLSVLKEMTEIIPPTVWVSNLTYSKKGLEIEGYADSASELIGPLEASPLFDSVTFLSAITKIRDGKERYRIGAHVETQHR